jgi:hypothetical protein
LEDKNMALLAPASIQMGQSLEEKLDTGKAVRKVAGILLSSSNILYFNLISGEQGCL